MFPDFWSKFIADNVLASRTIDIPAERDVSQVGIAMAFLTAEQAIDEATNFWPGIVVAKDGYVPVGACLRGNGDYYYVKATDGAAGPLYRIYHDAVDGESYDPAETIAIVLHHHDELLGYVERA